MIKLNKDEVPARAQLCLIHIEILKHECITDLFLLEARGLCTSLFNSSPTPQRHAAKRKNLPLGCEKLSKEGGYCGPTVGADTHK